MEKLFGVPIGQLLAYLLAIFAVGGVFFAYQALRHPVVFKLGVRNIPRRRAQTALVVLGLMLGTLLFSASFSTGDTLTHSIRVNFIRALGQVDEIVQSEQMNALGRPYFDIAQLDGVKSALSPLDLTEGIAPIAQERAPVVSPSTGLSEARADVLGLDADAMTSFDPLVDAQGGELSPAALGQGEAYISAELADEVDAKAGDTLHVFLGPTPTVVTVKGIYEGGAHPAQEKSLVLPLAQVQAARGNQGKINGIIINNKGNEIKGAAHSEAIAAALKPALDGSGLKVEEVKKERLKQADQAGSSFATAFLLFGQFSIAAGILLIFLIFIMLAAERKRELGIARAVGMQRGHLVRMFAFEGAMYSLLASAIGSLLGMAVGWAMARVMMVAFQEFDFKLTYSFNWRSLALAYAMGMVLTFAIVLIASWRASRLNIVRAVRDLPEPSMSRRSWRGLAMAILIAVAGVISLIGGLQSEQAALFNLGASLVIIGIPLIGRRLGLPDRAAFTWAGLGLVAWWLFSDRLLDQVLPEFKVGIEMFFLSGIMIVMGAVWAVVYNSDLLLWGIVKVFGRIKGAPPVLRTAVSYPMSSRSRTGMTLAMISLV
ncbi:MAG: FtsX-like permease family protein, partial [Chloroflexi bacterium]|nr:FtsX-like permease family protein [Chloroflexota bacterium]